MNTHPTHRPPPTASRDAGTWHHVMQRGASQRPVFPTRADVRSLEGLLAAAVRRGPLEVHAYSVLTTHCHLLVRCPRAGLTGALRDVFAPLARQINRRLGRDGALFGRSYVVPVTSTGHWRSVVAYLDRNAVEVGLADRPATYPFSSAWHYARAAGPSWLNRDVIEQFVRRRSPDQLYDHAAYVRVFGDRKGTLGSVALQRLKACTPLDPLDDLLASAPKDVQRWLESRARLADGVRAGPVLAGREAVLAAVARARSRSGPWRPGPRHRPGPAIDGWRVLAAGLLRASSGLGLAEIGAALGLSTPGAHQHVRRHQQLMGTDSTYAARSRDALVAALEQTFGPASDGVVDQYKTFL